MFLFNNTHNKTLDAHVLRASSSAASEGIKTIATAGLLVPVYPFKNSPSQWLYKRAGNRKSLCSVPGPTLCQSGEDPPVEGKQQLSS